MNIQGKKEEFSPYWDDTGESMDLYCNICEAYVQPGTKHCGPCNRCCEEFDHHCAWLNNCIGTANYANFRRLINAFLVFLMSNVLLFILALSKSLLTEERRGSKAVPILLWIQNSVNVIAIAFDLHLIGFHIWIRSIGISTF